MKIISITFFIMSIASSLVFADQDSTYTISGQITNFNHHDTLYMALFNSEQSFCNEKMFMRKRFSPEKLQQDTVFFRFDSIPEGYYLIAVYQDLNGDRKLNKGFFGPTEPYLIYQPRYGKLRPKFNKCKFQVHEDMKHIELRF